MAEGLTRESLRAGSPVGHLTDAGCQGYGGRPGIGGCGRVPNTRLGPHQLPRLCQGTRLRKELGVEAQDGEIRSKETNITKKKDHLTGGRRKSTCLPAVQPCCVRHGPRRAEQTAQSRRWSWACGFACSDQRPCPDCGLLKSRHCCWVTFLVSAPSTGSVSRAQNTRLLRW